MKYSKKSGKKEKKGKENLRKKGNQVIISIQISFRVELQILQVLRVVQAGGLAESIYVVRIVLAI